MSTEPLTSAIEYDEVRPSKTLGPTNPDETYARYERSLFRNYSLNPSKGTQRNPDGVNRNASTKNSLMNRFSSLRSKMGSERRGMQGGNSASGRRPKPDYSLAGPQQDKPGGHDDYDSYDSDEGFGDYGRRPSPTIGLAKPFPRQKRGGRWRKNKNQRKTQRVNERERTEPGSESGKPEGQVIYHSTSTSIWGKC